MPGEFDHKIESLGGLSNASTGYDDVHYHVLVPPSNFKESLALLTNIVVAPNSVSYTHLTLPTRLPV